MAATPHALFVEYLPQLDTVLIDPPVLEKGEYQVPETPGHGLRWDWEALQSYRVG